MKRISLAILTLLVVSLLMAVSCQRISRAKGNACATDVICTAIFGAVTIHVVDSNGQAVALDEVYTTRSLTGEKVTVSQAKVLDGTYTVVDDGFVKTLQNNTESFRFVGMKNGVKVVDEAYSISADCCHVSKKSGKEEVVL